MEKFTEEQDAYKRALAKAQKKPLSDEVEYLRKEVAALLQEKKRACLLSEVVRHNVIDPNEVVNLIEGCIDIDSDGKLCVTDGLNKVGVTVSEFVSKWLANRPHHVRNGKSKLQEVRSKYDFSDPAVWRDMPREDFDLIIRNIKEGN